LFCNKFLVQELKKLASLNNISYNKTRLGEKLPTNLPTCNTMSTMETPSTGPQKTFLFCSEFHFKPEGVKTVRETFEDELKANNLVGADVRIDYIVPDQTFRLRCLHLRSDEVWEIFSKVVRCLIKKEMEDNAHESESDSNIEDSDDESHDVCNIRQGCSLLTIP
jgi:hypothetical protein